MKLRGLDKLRWVRGYGGPVFDFSPPPPIGCTITLTGDLAGFGLTPFGISGQTVSVTADGSSIYGVSSGIAGAPVDWAGVRLVEFGVISFDGTDTSQQAIFQLARASDFLNAVVVYVAGAWTVGVADGAGAMIGSLAVSGTASDVFSIGIDGASGDAAIYKNGAVVADKTTTADSGSMATLGAMFDGQNVAIITQLRDAESGTEYSATIRTSSADFTQSYPAGTLDWCGNPI